MWGVAVTSCQIDSLQDPPVAEDALALIQTRSTPLLFFFVEAEIKRVTLHYSIRYNTLYLPSTFFSLLPLHPASHPGIRLIPFTEEESIQLKPQIARRESGSRCMAKGDR